MFFWPKPITQQPKEIHVWCMYVYVYIPATQMTLVLIEKDFVLEGPRLNIENKEVPEKKQKTKVTKITIYFQVGSLPKIVYQNPWNLHLRDFCFILPWLGDLTPLRNIHCTTLHKICSDTWIMWICEYVPKCENPENLVPKHGVHMHLHHLHINMHNNLDSFIFKTCLDMQRLC